MLKPTANGINPNIVVIAVNKTGRNLVLPPSIADSTIWSYGKMSYSPRFNSFRFLLRMRLV